MAILYAGLSLHSSQFLPFFCIECHFAVYIIIIIFFILYLAYEQSVNTNYLIFCIISSLYFNLLFLLHSIIQLVFSRMRKIETSARRLIDGLRRTLERSSINPIMWAIYADE